jgi:hypothetical protein
MPARQELTAAASTRLREAFSLWVVATWVRPGATAIMSPEGGERITRATRHDETDKGE